MHNWEKWYSKPFIGAVLVGIIAMGMALCGVAVEGPRERVGILLFGVGLTVGSGGSLILDNVDLSDEDRFAVRVAVRVGFMILAPAVVLSALPMLLERMGGPVSVALCLTTAVPAGLSLFRLVRKRRDDGLE